MNINVIRCDYCEKVFSNTLAMECDVCLTDAYLEEVVGELWIAHLSTTNFDFYLMANSEEAMWAELERSWNSHAKKTKATWVWEDVKDSVWYNKQHINRAWKRN